MRSVSLMSTLCRSTGLTMASVYWRSRGPEWTQDTPRLFQIVLVTIMLLGSPRVVAYEGAEHTDIGTQAKNLFLSVAQQREWCGVTPLTSQASWANIAQWLVQEDEGFNYLWHFWDPRGGNNNGLAGYDSAYTYAQTLFDTALLPAYASGDIETYIVVGRIAHLVADMGVPAHVLNDPHPWVEYYEMDYITIPENHIVAVVDDIRVSIGLYEIMYILASNTQKHPSNNSDGSVWIRDLYFEWDPILEAWVLKPGKGLVIADECYRGAIGSVANFFVVLFSLVHPTAGPIQPINVPISGIWGDIFDLYAFNYGTGELYSQASLTYTSVSPQPDLWDTDSWNQADFAMNEFMPITMAWHPITLNQRVWLRGRVWDSLFCESPPETLGWVDVDSTPPSILNVSISHP